MGSPEASEGPEGTLSGHGVPALDRIADALERALVARREGSPHAWARVLDAAEVVALELERREAEGPEVVDIRSARRE